jgi:hypothetical protein
VANILRPTFQLPAFAQDLLRGLGKFTKATAAAAAQHAAEEPPVYSDDAFTGIINPTHWPQRVVLVCGRYDAEWSEVAEWTHSVGAVMMAVGERLIPTEWLRNYSAQFDVIVVDCEHLDDVDSAIEFGLWLRREVPQVPVVFASREFKRHDFSTNRSAICDASLRMPLSRSAFFLGISAAIENHRARTQGRAQASESA